MKSTGNIRNSQFTILKIGYKGTTKISNMQIYIEKKTLLFASVIFFV